MEMTGVRVMWNSAIWEHGALCVTTNEAAVTPKCWAGNWAVAGPARLQEVLGVGRVQG